jgi:dihydroceramidase
VYAPFPASIASLPLIILNAADELSMHLLTTPLVYRLLTFKASPRRTMLIGMVLLSLFTLVMVTHVFLDEFVLHAVTFASGVLIVANRALKIISQHVLDSQIRQSLRNISLFGCCK